MASGGREACLWYDRGRRSASSDRGLDAPTKAPRTFGPIGSKVVGNLKVDQTLEEAGRGPLPNVALNVVPA